MARLMLMSNFPAGPEEPTSDLNATAPGKVMGASQFGSRIAIYSHDTFGLGHITRTLRLGRAILESLPDVSVLVLTGSPIAHRLVFPDRMEYVKLPSVRKRGPEEYVARDLGIPFPRLRRMRMQIIRDTLRAFRPHILFVDNVPLGMKGEILPSLEELKGYGAALHLNLRDILDEPQVVREQWRRDGVYEVLSSLYDEIHVFGDPSVHDSIAEYDLPRSKTEFYGYIAPPPSRSHERGLPTVSQTRESSVLVTIGGGEDGVENIRCALDVERSLDGRARMRFDLVLGPLMGSRDAEALLRQIRNERGISAREYVENLADSMPAYDVVLSMGGYNTLCEVMARARRSVVIPRTHPRREQELRARALESREVLRVIHPEERTPERLLRTLCESLERGPVLPSSRMPRLDGLERFKRRMEEIASSWRRRPRNPGRARRGRARARSHRTSGAFLLTAALVLGLSGRAQADLRPRGVNVEALVGYDTNILDGSDAEIAAFETHDPGSFFVVDRMSDEAYVANVSGKWKLRHLGNKTDLRLGYSRLQYFHVPIRTENRYSILWGSRLGATTLASLSFEFAPNIYSRHRLDKDALPGDPVFRAEVRNEWNSSLRIGQALSSAWSSEFVLEGSVRDYRQPFNERDRWRVGARSGLVWQASPGRPRISVSGGFRRTRSRNVPYVGSDLSYREWSLQSSFDASGLSGFFHFGGYVNREWRHYTSTDPNDQSHFGRQDDEWNVGGFVQHALTSSLDWKATVDHTRRNAQSSLITEDLDEAGTIRDTFVTTGLAWHWQR